MKKIIMAAAVALAAIGSAQAAPIAPRHDLLIHTGQGETLTYHFADKPVVTFSGDDMVVTSLETPALSFAMENIVNMTFAEDWTGVEAVAATGKNIFVTSTTLTVSGMNDGARVDIFDMGGARVATATANADGRADSDISRLTKGVYTVSADGISFKFIK